MAQTVTGAGTNVVTVTFSDTSDWTWKTDTSLPQSTTKKLSCIVFKPGAANDVLYVRNETIAPIRLASRKKERRPPDGPLAPPPPGHSSHNGRRESTPTNSPTEPN